MLSVRFSKSNAYVFSKLVQPLHSSAIALQNADEGSSGNVTRIPKHVSNKHKPVNLFEKRRLFGKIGLSSGMAPSLAWPTKEELSCLNRFSEQFEKPLNVLLTQLRREQELTVRAEQDRVAKVAKAMAEMPDLIAKFHAKRARRAGDVSKMDEKRQALLDEAREYFGYELSPRDPRFLELVERKQEEEKRLKKKLRKEKRVERTVLSLTGGQISTSTSPSSAVPNEITSST